MKNNNEFQYMLLSRLQSDCGYFLGHGNGSERSLWAGNVQDQITKMKELWEQVPVKPEWLSYAEIEGLEKDMLKLLNSKNSGVSLQHESNKQ